MPEIQFVPSFITMIVAAIISLLFSYFPGLKTWFAALSSEIKSGIMIVLMILVGVVVTLLSCNGIIQSNIVCTKQGFYQVAWNILLAIVANQSAYAISPEDKNVKAIKLSRDG